MSAHLFSLNGEKWKRLRTKLTPTFTSAKMKFIFPTMVAVAEQFRDCLHEAIQQQNQLEMKDLLSRFTTDIIGTCAFGIECNSLKDPNAAFRHHGRMLFEKPRHSGRIRRLLDEYSNIGRWFHVKKIPNEIADFFLKVVHQTVDQRERNKISRKDFMDLLIRLKNENKNTSNKEISISFNELAAAAFVFFQAGFESSSTTLAFCLYELALNPGIQAKARRIIQEAYAKHDGNFTYEMMMDLPYIDQILYGKLGFSQNILQLFSMIVQ